MGYLILGSGIGTLIFDVESFGLEVVVLELVVFGDILFGF